MFLCVMSCFRAMQRYLGLCDLDDNVTASLKADVESLAGEIQLLEQAWKQSLLTAAAVSRHSSHHDDCPPSSKCASDETEVSECRCVRTSQVVCEPSDNCASSTTGVSDSHYDRTCQVDKHCCTQTGRSLGKASDSDCCDGVAHKTVQTNMCQELTTNNGVAKADTSLLIGDACNTDTSVQTCTSTISDVCREFVTSAEVDTFFTDQLQLAQYKSCCSKLDMLFSVFLSVSK